MTGAPRIFAYNPDLLTPEETKAGFIARSRELEDALDDLRHARPQHRLFFGPRGMGKTTLLRRLAVAIDEDPALAARWIPLGFSEEQYGVACLGDLWLNCLDALADRAQRTGVAEQERALDARIDALGGLEPQRRAREARAELDRLAGGRGYVLLVDNLDLLLSRLSDDEQWALREALGTGRFVMIGASVGRPASTYEYGKPFYELLRAVRLGGLDEEETDRLLRMLSERRGTPDVVRILDQQPGRIAALRMLSGGNPRALVLVHQILAKGGAETALDDVEALLDLMTPLYKAKFEALSAQQQSVVDAVAIAFDPIATAAIAERIRLPVKHVSAVLGRLVEDGVLERVTLPRNKTAFLISERLFNIWYLMRASRRARRSLTWLVKFYESFYGAGSTEDLAQKILERAETSPREAQLLLACATVLPASPSKRRSEVRAIEAMLKVSEAVQGLDLRGEDRDLAPIVDRMKTLKEIKRLLADVPPIAGLPASEFVAGMYPVPIQLRLRIARALARGEPGAVELFNAGTPSREPKFQPFLRAAADGIVGDWTTAADDVAVVDAGMKGVVAGLAWLHRPESGLRALDTIREITDGMTWVSALAEAYKLGYASELRRWLQSSAGAHRSLATAIDALRHARGSEAEPFFAEWALAAVRRGCGGEDDLVSADSPAPHELHEQTAVTALRLRAAIDAGTAPELIDSLSASPDAERLRPVLEAARAALGDGSLAHLAPEIRAPAEHLLRFFQMKIERWDFEPVAPAETQTRVRTPAKKPGRARKSR